MNITESISKKKVPGVMSGMLSSILSKVFEQNLGEEITGELSSTM